MAKNQKAQERRLSKRRMKCLSASNFSSRLFFFISRLAVLFSQTGTGDLLTEAERRVRPLRNGSEWIRGRKKHAVLDVSGGILCHLGQSYEFLNSLTAICFLFFS